MYSTSNLTKYRPSASTNPANLITNTKKPAPANNQNILKNQFNKVRELSPSTPNKQHQNSYSYHNILQKIGHTTKKSDNTPDPKHLYKSNPKTPTLNGQPASRNEDREARRGQPRNSFLDKSNNQEAKLKTPQQNKIVLERPYSSTKAKRTLSSNYSSSKGYKSPVSNFVTPTNDIPRVLNVNSEVERNKAQATKYNTHDTSPISIILENKRRSSPDLQTKRCMSSSKLVTRDIALDFGTDTGSKPLENIMMPMTTANSTTNQKFCSGLRSTKSRRYSQLESSLMTSTRTPSKQLFITKARSSTKLTESKSNNISIAVAKDGLNRAPEGVESAKIQRQNTTKANFSQYRPSNLKDNNSSSQEPLIVETKRSNKRCLTSRNNGQQSAKENNDAEMSNYLKENLITRIQADPDENNNSILAMLPKEIVNTEKTNSSQAQQTLQNISWSRRKTIEDKPEPNIEKKDLTIQRKYKRSQSESPYIISGIIKQEYQFDQTNDDVEHQPEIKQFISPSEALSKEIQKQILDLKNRNIQRSGSAAKIKTAKESEQSVEEYYKEKPDKKSAGRIGIYDLISKNVQKNIQNKLQDEPFLKPASSKTPSQDISILSISSEEREAKKAIFKRDYLVGKEIGQGAYAAVRTGLHKPTNTHVAIKIYEKAKIAEPLRRKSVRREIKVMERMNHTNVIQIYDIFETRKYVSIVMEYVDGKSLYSLVKSQPSRRLKESHAYIIFKQLIEGLNYCHDRCITHRDIKLENVLITRMGIIKIIDFGFTTCIPNDKKVKLFCGTPCYMAPEIVTKQEYCGPPVDIWASGILLYVLLCGSFPFKGDTNPELFKSIAKGEFAIPDYIPDVLIILLKRMLHVDPDKRPTAKEILADPWFIYQSVLQNKKSGSKHRRSLSAEKTRSERVDHINEDLYNSIKAQNVANELLNPGKGNNDDEINIIDDMKFERFNAEEKVQEMLDLKLYQTNPQSVKHDKRSKTTLVSRPKTTRFIFDEDSGGLSKTNLKKSNDKAFEDIKATVTGILEPKDTYDDQKFKKKTFNEVEIWNTGDYASQKSGKKVFDRYSILNKTIGLSRNHDNRDISPARYEPKLIKNLVRMGYTEDEIINGLKDKNAVISTVYNWLVESKVVSKESVSIGSISSETVTSNENSYTMSSPPVHLKKRRTPSSHFNKQTPSTNVSTELKNTNQHATSNIFKVNTILNRNNAPLNAPWGGNQGLNS